MEQKRTLWIVAAVGIFLLVVVGAALIIYAPQSSGYSPESGFVTQTHTFDNNSFAPRSPFESTTDNYVATNPTDAQVQLPNQNDIDQSTQVAQISNELKSENLTVYATNTTVYSQNEPNSQVQGQIPVTVNFDLNNLMSTPSASAPVEKEVAKNKPVTDDSYYAPTPAPKKEEAPKVVAKTTTKPQPKPQAKPAPKKEVKPQVAKIPDRFWVQAASYTNKEGADKARQSLEQNKIPSEVFTYTDSKGKLFYRVRVGPYTTSSEAEYWQRRVAKIDQFASTPSYIVNSSAKVR